MTGNPAVAPFLIDVPQADVDDLVARLRRTRWTDAETVRDWSQGVPLEYLRELCAYWADGYRWRDREALVNRLPQVRVTVDGIGIHAVHVRSPEPGAMPLVLTHGWPGSVVEFLEVVGPLTDPAAHGGDPRDAFHLVLPSLPGFGFSDRPRETGWNRERIADAWAELMTVLGYDRFAAQGGDWGASISCQLGIRDPDRVIGVHVNLVGGGPGPDAEPADAEERRALAEYRAAMARHVQWESGYQMQQASRPQTLGYGLVDSPVAQCAWILEKFHAWTDCAGDPVGAFGADRLLDDISVYWFTATATSSARLYWESRPTPFATPVEVPVGASVFPKEIGRPFRPWAEEVYRDLRYWNEVERGGHFAAFEQPELFVREVRACFRLLRQDAGRDRGQDTGTDRSMERELG